MKGSKAAFNELISLLRPYRKHMGFALLLSLLPAYFAVWIPYLIGRLVDEGLIRKDLHNLLLFSVLLLFAQTFHFLFTVSVNFVLSAFGLEILVEYRDQLLKKILSYPISFFDKISSGQLTTRLTTDVNSLQELFSSALVPLVGNSFLIVGVSVAMLLINFRLAIVSLLVVPLLFWLTSVFHYRIRRRFGFMRKSLSAVNAFAGESFSGNRDLQVLNALDQNEKEFSQLSRRLQVRYTEAVAEYAIYNPLVPFLTSLMDIFIILFGGWQVYHRQMTVGEVVAFLAYASHFGWPVRDFAEKFTVLQQALAAVDRLLEVSSHDPEEDRGPTLYKGNSKIEFKSVNYTYQGSNSPALKNISFEAFPGEKIALLGETGSGKSTTCSLLMRFYEPQLGEIEIGGKDIRGFALNSLRNRIGWVSQDVTLFSATLRENLRFYDLEISDEQIWEALKLVQLDAWIQKLPKGLDAKLSERGSSFSSGQRQLLSLARAVIRKPSILIFDEATSYVDSQTEWMLQQAVENLWKSSHFQGMTGFFIAHRLSTLKRCDRMLVYKDGSIVESGTYEELMKMKGYAAQLYEEQFRKLAPGG